MTTRGRGSPLGRALRAGALYDWIIALAILGASAPLFAWLRLPPPADFFTFRMMALPLIFFGLLYWMVGADPEERWWGVHLSIAIRILGGVFLAVLVLLLEPPGRSLYLVTALADLVWGALWAALARR